MHRLKFVVAVIVGDEASAVDKEIGGGRPLLVVIVITALGVRLPDVEQRIGQSAACIQAPDPAADDQHGSGFERRRDLATKWGIRTMVRAEDVLLGGASVGAGRLRGRDGDLTQARRRQLGGGRMSGLLGDEFAVAAQIAGSLGRRGEAGKNQAARGSRNPGFQKSAAR